MRKPTGQMQEQTQKYLDDYNTLYNWEYNDMCRFIENYSEEEFVEHYETYYRLCDDYGTELVENFEDLYEGHFETATDFAEYWCTDVEESTKNLPDYVTIDYADVWENKLSKDYFEIDCDMSEYTYGHIFRKKLNIFSKDS